MITPIGAHQQASYHEGARAAEIQIDSDSMTNKPPNFASTDTHETLLHDLPPMVASEQAERGFRS
jgi:hypothetical protein